MRFFGTDDEIFFVAEERHINGTPGKKSIFQMTAPELKACRDKQEKNIAADYERLAPLTDPFLVFFLD